MLGFTSLGQLPSQTSTAAILSSAALSASEASDAVAINVTVRYEAALAATEAPDVTSISIQNTRVELVASEFPDAASIALSIFADLSMSAIEAADGTSISINVIWVQPDEPNDASIWVPVNDGLPYNQTVI